MKRLIQIILILSGVLVGLFLFLLITSRRGEHRPEATAGRRLATPLPATAARQSFLERRPSSNHAFSQEVVGRFTRDVLPVATRFLERIETLASDGILAPIDSRITTNQLSSLKFIGGASNTVCTFVLERSHVFAYHSVIRDGQEQRGIHYFGRAGTDDTGTPLNLDQLMANAAGHQAGLSELSNTNQYPPVPLDRTAMLAQRLFGVLRPDDAGAYALGEYWREAVGSMSLPYYTFTYPRKGASTTEPFNLMRDETVIRFKSTGRGVVLDFYEDTSIAFPIKPKEIRP